ncbi:putative Utp25 U3 small nucleolar RNA associated SSU processome protein 25 [Trypanosoma vivax]|nr:putative Utp25 U3 small nucleolar RNA associated SSU processome protein 25 [Trypanosoma vivax]
MGKPGGFFKRLKTKQKRLASRKRRGTKGASKEERRLKHNELVDYYAAKREVEELAAVSSSSSSDDLPSTDSDGEAREEKSLLKLRRVLGVLGGERTGKRPRDNMGKHNSISNDKKVKSKRTDVGMSGDSEHVDSGYYNTKERAADLKEDEDNENWEAFIPLEEEEEEEENLDVLDGNEDYGSAHSSNIDGDSAMQEGQDTDGDWEEGEEDFTAKEDAYEDDESDENNQRLEEERAQLLPRFQPGTTDFTALQQVVYAGDPWFVKYHEDKHGAVDTTAMKPIGMTLQQGLGYSECENIAVSASTSATRHLLHQPFVFEDMKFSSRLSKDRAEVRPCYMHEALWGRWLKYRAAESRGPMTLEQRGLLDLLQGYPDVMDCCRSWENAEARREVFLLHMLNHWFKARAVMLAHDTILRGRQREKCEANSVDHGVANGDGNNTRPKKSKKGGGASSFGEDTEDYELRDRGFGRTRLIIMLPMRNIAYRYVNTLVKLLGVSPEACPRLSTFNEDFTELEEAMDPNFTRRPPDFQRQFEGNIDDTFCVGLKLEPSSIRVYTHPLNSDLIICSPLGLRRRLERNGDVLVSLSSIEVCIIDEAHVLLMQNWQHVMAVLRMLNRRPRDTTYGLADLRRVYAWALEGRSGRHRQTIVSTDVTNAALLATFRTFLNNSGRVLLQRREEVGVLQQVMVPVRQHFMRFEPGNSVESCDDARFDFFIKEVFSTKIAPLISRDVRTIVFVPSYFDYVRLRNHMIREHRDSFASICEYTSLKQQRKSLGQFTDLERPLLLVTERFYFFRRYFVKHAEVIVFYSPPISASFYASLVSRLVSNSPSAFALTLFCRYDSHELNRLVGTKRARQLLEREPDVYSFVTN